MSATSTSVQLPAPAREGGASGTVEKALDVLFHLHASGAAGVTAIGRALGLPKSSVHRHLAPLLRRGLVERDERGRYRPGMGLVALGLGVLEREPVVLAARPVLEACAEELGETFFLVCARAGQLVVLEKAEGTGFLRAAPRVGTSVPVHATAVGKLYLAFAPDEVGAGAGVAVPGDAAAPSHARLERFTEHTLVDAAQLDAAVEAARERGVAINRDEWIAGLSVLAAPIRLGDRMVGAVALAAPSSRVDALGEDALCARVGEAAGRITRRLTGGSATELAVDGATQGEPR